MNYSPIIVHLERYLRGEDRSVKWAKAAETLLDEIEPWDELLDELRDDLSLYRPEGGPHLVNESAMEGLVRRALKTLESRAGTQAEGI